VANRTGLPVVLAVAEVVARRKPFVAREAWVLVVQVIAEAVARSFSWRKMTTVEWEVRGILIRWRFLWRKFWDGIRVFAVRIPAIICIWKVFREGFVEIIV
jgi:hypothetical protein